MFTGQCDLGGDWNDVVCFSKPMEARHGFLTANNQVPYLVASIHIKDAPMVVEVSAASETTKLFGSFTDASQLPIADVGPPLGRTLEPPVSAPGGSRP